MNTLTQRHRAQQLLLRRATQAQVAKVWPLLDFADLDGSYPSLAVALAKLTTTNRQTSAGLAATYLRQFRKAHGVGGSLPLVLADPLNVDQFSTALRVTSVVAAKRATANDVLPDAAMRTALTQTTGSIARLVLNAGRETITRTITADPKAHGYQRVLGGSGCEFCQMLAGRGAVYGEGTAEFEAHDHCGCSAEPIYA